MTVQGDQRQLDFLMSGIAMQLALFGSEHREDIVHVLLHHVEETALAGGFIIGDRCFQNMAGAVKLVAVAQALPAVMRLLDDEIGVHITVRALRSGH